MEHFFPQIQVKTKKKMSSPKMEHFFLQIQVDTYSQMPTRVKLLGGDADVDHRLLKLLGEIIKLLGGIYLSHPPPPLPVFGTPDGNPTLKTRGYICTCFWS